jgi:soluble lytic murein transglycosylase-like protein
VNFLTKFVVLTGLTIISAVALASDLAILHNGFSIRHERREVRGNITRLYTGTADTSYIDVPSADIDRFEKDDNPPPVASTTTEPAAVARSTAISPLKAAQPVNLEQVVKDASGKQLIDPDFINSVIRAESGFNTRAVSPKGAQGLMQLMPGTASNLGVGNAFDPTANVDGGTRYLRSLLEKYNYDVPKALAAYNAGPHRVDQYHGVPPYFETRAYVARIIRDFNKKKLAQQKAAAAAARKSQPKSTAARSTKQAAHANSSPDGVASGSR